MKGWREFAIEFNQTIEEKWQEYMAEHYEELVERLKKNGITEPDKINKFFTELKQDIQLDMIQTFKENLRKLVEASDKNASPSSTQ